MVQGFLFDRINAVAARAPVGGQYDFIGAILAHETQPPLAVAQFAEAWAEVTLNPPVFELVPVLGTDGV